MNLGFLKRGRAAVDGTLDQAEKRVGRMAGVLASVATSAALKLVSIASRFLFALAAVLFCAHLLYNRINEGVEERSMARLAIAVETLTRQNEELLRRLHDESAGGSK